MNSVKFELDIEGLREIMKSKEMQSILSENAGKVQITAGRDYGSKTYEGGYTAISVIYPENGAGMTDNAEHNTLLKALQGTGLPLTKG